MQRWVRILGLFWALAWVDVALGVDVEGIELGRRDGWVLLNLRARELLDTKITSTIESGLPGTCVYRVVLRERAGPTVVQRLMEFSLRLDLWEELYILETPARSRTFASLEEADAAWSRLHELRLFPTAELRASATYEVAVEVIVRPLAAADRARVAEFVRQTSSGDTQEFALDVGSVLSRLLGGDRQSSATPMASVTFVVGELEQWP